jgi:EmrB/QacA subfamily drug resistance transporter
VLAATILGSSMAFIDSTVVNVALPALQSSLHATVVDVEWVIESYGLLLSALILVGGALGDALGRRAMFLLGVAIFGAASAGCGFSATIRTLVLWRGVQGLGAALLVPGSLAIISASFDQKSRGPAIGTWSGFTAITAALGPPLGGWLIEHASWHWVFFINLPLATLVIFMTLRYVPESRNPNAGRIDWPGAACAAFGLAALVYGFVESGAVGWNHRVVATLISGLLLMALFVLIEKNTKAPMMPLDLFKSSSFSGANLLTLFLYAATGTLFFLLPMDLIQIKGYSATEAGAAILPIILLIFLLSRWSGGLVTRFGSKAPLMFGPLVVAAGFVLIALPPVRASYWTGSFPGLVVLGFGMAISVAPLTTVVMGSVDQARAGSASGINNAVARVAGVLAIAIFGLAMVAAFARSLRASLVILHLDPDVVRDLESNVARLGALEAPPGLDSRIAAQVHDVIAGSFAFGFRIIMLICAGLALGSAMIAWRMIPAGDPATNE